MLNQKKFYILTLSLIGFTKPIKNYGAEYRTFTIKNTDLFWRGVLRGIKKAVNPLQPVYEAITNSFEAIDLRRKNGDDFKASIILDLYYNVTTEDNPDGLSKICITDNGIGFDDENFQRLKTYNPCLS